VKEGRVLIHREDNKDVKIIATEEGLVINGAPILWKELKQVFKINKNLTNSQL
jgi:hypothetical protein